MVIATDKSRWLYSEYDNHSIKMDSAEMDRWTMTRS